MLQCTVCKEKLTGRQKLFCSNLCKRKTDNNKFQSSKAQKMRGMKRRSNLINKLGGKCSICDYSKNYAALVFHHKDPSEKSFSLDMRSCSNRQPKVLESEAAKCLLLCSNCHMEIHHPTYKVKLKKLASSVSPDVPSSPSLTTT